jgi:hypothetical protein
MRESNSCRIREVASQPSSNTNRSSALAKFHHFSRGCPRAIANPLSGLVCACCAPRSLWKARCAHRQRQQPPPHLHVRQRLQPPRLFTDLAPSSCCSALSSTATAPIASRSHVSSLLDVAEKEYFQSFVRRFEGVGRHEQESPKAAKIFRCVIQQMEFVRAHTRRLMVVAPWVASPFPMTGRPFCHRVIIG